MSNDPTLSLSDKEKSQLRQIASETLHKLQTETEEASCIRSWIQQTNLPFTSSHPCRFFHYTGFLHVPSFADEQECERLQAEMADLVEKHWHPDELLLESFGTDSKQNAARGDYFLDSADKVHYFAEPQALSADGTQQLLPAFQDSKLKALNKAGHALHLQPGPFADYSTSPKIQKLVQDLGWQDPVVPQSMYIFKNASLGGAVNSHQDSTFLYTFPKQSCLGLWLALEEATLDNGCLWVRPKSHQEPVRRQYKLSGKSEPKFVMQDLYPHDIVWDGSLPGSTTHDLLEAGFIPIECQAGDLLAFCGELDHLSLPNHSDKSRHTFQLHLVEGTVKWSESNWLQYPEGKPFLRLFGQD